MAPDRRLQERFRGLAEAIYPEPVLAQERAVRGALNADGTLRPDALTNALPWQRIDFFFPGEPVVGTSFGGIFEIPQGGRIRRVTARCRNAPSSGPFSFTLYINGVASDYSSSIQQGSTAETSGADLPVPEAGVVSVGVTSVGDARDVTISVFYSALGGI